MTSTVPIAQQTLRHREVHDWYQFVWGYSDHLVAGLIEEFRLGSRSLVLDPFCGTGTTLVECMKHSVPCVGVDASPASLFVSRVKTNLALDAGRLLRYLDDVRDRLASSKAKRLSVSTDPTFRYMKDSGMVERGWISPGPLRRALRIKAAILSIRAPAGYRDAMLLALIDTVVRDASNVRFGPELYVGPPRRYVAIADAFVGRVMWMATDLTHIGHTRATSRVLKGDARRVGALFRNRKGEMFDALICSPPYPAEHDYTRNARLELAFLEALSETGSLRAIKKSMITSHTKGVYVSRRDWQHAWLHPRVANLAAEVDRKAAGLNHGFARLYSTVIASYFGGMLRHFESVRRLMKPRSQLAYVVSDQASYGNVPIPTAVILGELAEWVGFSVVEIRHWRQRRATVTARRIDEEILILRLD